MKTYHNNQEKKLFEHLFEADYQTVTRLCLPKDKEIPEHQHPWNVLVVIYKGSVSFTGENGSKTITPGDLIQLSPNEKHSLIALEDAELFVIKSQLPQ